MKNEKSDLQTLVKEKKISSKTMERVNIAKSYIEKKYSLKRSKEEEKKNSNLQKLKILIFKDWDFFNKQLDDLKLSEKEKDLIKKDVLHKEAEYLRMQ